ncbi:MAG: hypothetical protein ACT4O1_03515 [Gemmatimonadota bacterium]
MKTRVLALILLGVASTGAAQSPVATSESTGLPAKPEPNKPWIMFSGTAKAHIMFVPRM